MAASSSSSRFAFAPSRLGGFEGKQRACSVIVCSSAQDRHEPFNQSLTARGIKEPSLLEKAEHALSDECVLLDGDEAYDCWEALFEFDDLKKSTAFQRLENLVRQSPGVSSLINSLHRFHTLHKAGEKKRASSSPASAAEDRQEHAFFEPGSLPKTEEEIAEEESALMPDSLFTKLLRRRGTIANWFTAPIDP